MPRPRKCRKVCCMPDSAGFSPVNPSGKEAVILTVDEYETIRLMDYRGFTQEECCKFMNVARTTVQMIYANARSKISTAIVEGRPLIIKGGDYSLCDGKESFCKCGGCRKHRLALENGTKSDG